MGNTLSDRLYEALTALDDCEFLDSGGNLYKLSVAIDNPGTEDAQITLRARYKDGSKMDLKTIALSPFGANPLAQTPPSRTDEMAGYEDASRKMIQDGLKRLK